MIYVTFDGLCNSRCLVSFYHNTFCLVDYVCLLLFSWIRFWGVYKIYFMDYLSRLYVDSINLHYIILLVSALIMIKVHTFLQGVLTFGVCS